MNTYNICGINVQQGQTVKVIRPQIGEKGQVKFVPAETWVRKIKSIRKVKNGIKVHFEHTGETGGFGFAVTFNEQTTITMEL